MNHPIVIVGAGIVGASIAWNLARRGKPVLILDQTGIGKGATGRSFGWINANFAPRGVRDAVAFAVGASNFDGVFYCFRTGIE